METVVKALYNTGFSCWNTLMRTSMTLFTTSPKTAGNSQPYAMMHTLYESLSAATIPIATCFFLIAIYRSVVTGPPEQQVRRFLTDAIKYTMILVVTGQLWTIMGHIISITDGMTTSLGAAGTYELSMGSDLERIIHESLVLPPFELSGEWIGKLLESLGCSAMFLIGGVTIILVMTASGLSIISSAYGRILKPLIMMPFAGIALAMGAGSGEMGRSTYQFAKTFIGFCLSGAVMVVIIKAGGTLSTAVVTGNLLSGSSIENALIITVQACITPIITAGMVKAADQVISRMF